MGSCLSGTQCDGFRGLPPHGAMTLNANERIPMANHTASETYEILAIKYAERLERTRRENYLFDDDHASRQPIDFFVWVIRNGARTIVVDTGYDRAEAARRERTLSHEPRDALKSIGIDAAKVDQVVVTHLHWDHAGCLDHFEAAKFHLQEAEMAYATGACMCEGVLRMPFTADHVCAMVKRVYSGKVAFHDGDAEIAPGVSVHKIGGHSRGLQCVRVMTARGPVVLASDASHFYENFEKRKPFPIVVDVMDSLRGYDTLQTLAGSAQRVIPGHDPLVLARYPALNKATQGVVHRLDVAPKE